MTNKLRSTCGTRHLKSKCPFQHSCINGNDILQLQCQQTSPHMQRPYFSVIKGALCINT